MDEFPINEKVALQLAGLHAQVLWGDYDRSLMNRYDDLRQYLHPRIMSANKSYTMDDWKLEIAMAHEVRRGGKGGRGRERERERERERGERKRNMEENSPLDLWH